MAELYVSPASSLDAALMPIRPVDIMRVLAMLICSIAVGPFLGGCSSHDELVSDSSSPNGNHEAERVSEVYFLDVREKEVLVFRGKYYQTTGPCIQLGDSLGMPIIDAFEVVEVVEGALKAKHVNVRAMTEGGSSYPKEMAVGKIYTLRLTLADETSTQLRENESKGYTFLWIDGDEIEEQKETK